MISEAFSPALSVVPYIIAGCAAVIVLVMVIKAFYLVRQAEVMIIERLGRYNRTLGPGLHFVVPILESPRRVLWSHIKEVDRNRYYRFTKVIERIDLREAVYDFPKQSVITKDNVTTEINAIVYYHITDPKAAVYEVYDLPQAIEKLSQTTLRNIIGSMDLDSTLVSRDQINAHLRATLDESASHWGVNVTRVELQEVNPPDDIKQAMEKQMRAERDRRAVILEAEGAKQSAILRAEGDRESQILQARGSAESKVILAKGEADARLQSAQAESGTLELLQKNLSKKDAAAYLVALQYMKVLPQLTEGKNSKLVVLPYEATSIMGSLAGIKTILEDAKTAQDK